jgi:gas vesicle protein
MDAGKVVVVALTGVAVGALVGILFAPNKGSVTRRKISRKSAHAVDDVKDKFSDLMEGISDKFEEEKEALADAYDKIKHRVQEFSKDGQKA